MTIFNYFRKMTTKTIKKMKVEQQRETDQREY